MNKLWIIARKDIRESFRSRSTYIYVGVLILLTFINLSNYRTSINNLQSPSTQTIIDTSRSYLNFVVYTLPLIYSILVCAIFAQYSVIVDKAKRNIESLMVTPLSLKQIWLGKSLAVTLPSIIIGLAVSILAYLITNFTVVMSETGSFIFPSVVSIVTAFILVPLLIFSVVTIVIYMQLIISNPRIANFVFTGLFLLFFFGSSILTSMAISIDFSIIFLGLFVICSIISYILSYSLTKEKVLQSTKG
jgi:ABC-2 type transport system permease protein